MMIQEEMSSHYRAILTQLGLIQPRLWALGTTAKQLRLMAATLLCCAVRMSSERELGLRVLAQDMQQMANMLLSEQQTAESRLEQLNKAGEQAVLFDEAASTSMTSVVHQLQQVLASLDLIVKQGDYLATMIALEAKKETPLSPRLAKVSHRLEQLMMTLEQETALSSSFCDTIAHHVNRLNKLSLRSVLAV